MKNSKGELQWSYFFSGSNLFIFIDSLCPFIWFWNVSFVCELFVELVLFNFDFSSDIIFVVVLSFIFNSFLFSVTVFLKVKFPSSINLFGSKFLFPDWICLISSFCYSKISVRICNKISLSPFITWLIKSSG